MLFRILKVWLHWRKDWDSLCNRCGKCCYTRSIRPDGEVIIHYNTPCKHLDTETHLCKVFDDRFHKCNHCGKVSLLTALFEPSLPKDCAYVQTFRLWDRDVKSK